MIKIIRHGGMFTFRKAFELATHIHERHLHVVKHDQAHADLVLTNVQTSYEISNERLHVERPVVDPVGGVRWCVFPDAARLVDDQHQVDDAVVACSK